MGTFLLFLLSFVIGYLLFLYFNDPVKEPWRKKNKLPKLKYKNIEILPYFRIHIRKRTYHIHHWVTLTIITSITFLWYEGAQHLVFLKGAAIGGIFHGLRYPDRFKFRHPRQK